MACRADVGRRQGPDSPSLAPLTPKRNQFPCGANIRHDGEALWGILVEIDLDVWPLVEELLPLLNELERIEALAAEEEGETKEEEQ